MISEILNKVEWDEVLKSVDAYDFYHTFDYHAISKREDEQAVFLVYRLDHVLIGLPLLIRSIEGANYFDATSVYGYAGPVIKNYSSSINFSEFQNCLERYFEEKKIISIFSRLNPYINNQEHIINGIGYIDGLGDIVNIDITKEIDLQRQLYSKSTKNRVNKARKLCHVKIGSSEKDIMTFIDIYYENMNRVNAKKEYYFSKEYFMNIVNSKDFQVDVSFAVLNENNEIISAAMMIKTNSEIIQYHLSGTKNDYLNLNPMGLLIDETRISGTKEGYKYFNLGGGLGSESDSLFNFKANFSKDFKKFQVWKYIVNKKVYDMLVEQNNCLSKDINFFPLYRYNLSENH